MTREPGKPIRVLVADDSTTIREFLAEVIDADSRFAVVGKAADGQQTVDAVDRLRPDVVVLDMVMPKLDGAAATEWVMAHRPTPILVCSAAANRGEIFKTHDALARGAVDVIEKPGGSEDVATFVPRLLDTLATVARIRVITHIMGRGGSRPPVASGGQPGRAAVLPLSTGPYELVTIAASTGGPGAVAQLLDDLGDLALPVIVVLHLDPAFGSGFTEWLDSRLSRPVTVATHGQALPAPPSRQVLVAPGGLHTRYRNGRLYLDDGPERNYCRPSADVTFESLARGPGPRTIACVLTGMGGDGAAGLLALRGSGALTIAQDEASSLVFGMPAAAIRAGAACRVLALGQMGAAIRNAVKRSKEGSA